MANLSQAKHNVLHQIFLTRCFCIETYNLGKAQALGAAQLHSPMFFRGLHLVHLLPFVGFRVKEAIEAKVIYFTVLLTRAV